MMTRESDLGSILRSCAPLRVSLADVHPVLAVTLLGKYFHPDSRSVCTDLQERCSCCSRCWGRWQVWFLPGSVESDLRCKSSFLWCFL